MTTTPAQLLALWKRELATNEFGQAHFATRAIAIIENDIAKRIEK